MGILYFIYVVSGAPRLTCFDNFGYVADRSRDLGVGHIGLREYPDIVAYPDRILTGFAPCSIAHSFQAVKS